MRRLSMLAVLAGALLATPMWTYAQLDLGVGLVLEQAVEANDSAGVKSSEGVQTSFGATYAHDARILGLFQPVLTLRTHDEGDDRSFFLGAGARLDLGNSLLVQWTVVAAENPHNEEPPLSGTLTGGFLVGSVGLQGSWHYPFPGEDNAESFFTTGVFLRL